MISDQFGKDGCHSEVDIGWLTTQLEVRLSFLKNPIRWWKTRHQTQKYSMKVSATDPKVSPFYLNDRNGVVLTSKDNFRTRICVTTLILFHLKSRTENGVVESASMDSMQDSLLDYALMHEEQEGILGPMKYAVLTAPPKGKRNTDQNQEAGDFWSKSALLIFEN